MCYRYHEIKYTDCYLYWNFQYISNTKNLVPIRYNRTLTYGFVQM